MAEFGRCGMSTTVEALTAIREKHGKLTAELVVSEAVDPDHPLHDRFEWDDAVAGHAYRVTQAGQLLRVVRLPADDSAPKDLRAFMAVRSGASVQADYVPTREALSDPVARQVILRQMEREWKSLRRRYQDYAEFAEMVASDMPNVKSGAA